MTTLESVKGIVTRIVHCDEQDINPTTTWKDLKADSLDLVQILVALEETFNIEISDEAAEGFTNMGDVVTYIDRCLAERGAHA